MSNENDYYMKKHFFVTLGGYTQYKIDKICQAYPEAGPNDVGSYPVFAFLRAAMKWYENSSSDTQDQTVETQLKKERVIKERIQNQTKLGKLIPKEDAKIRMLRTLGDVGIKIKYAIKESSVSSVGIQDPRIIEAIMIDKHNQAIKKLEESCRLVEWEHEQITTVEKTLLQNQEKLVNFKEDNEEDE